MSRSYPAEAKSFCPVYSHLVKAYASLSGLTEGHDDNVIRFRPVSGKTIHLVQGSDWTVRYYGISMMQLEELGSKLASMALQAKIAFYYRDVTLESAWEHFQKLNPLPAESVKEPKRGKPSLPSNRSDRSLRKETGIRTSETTAGGLKILVKTKNVNKA